MRTHQGDTFTNAMLNDKLSRAVSRGNRSRCDHNNSAQQFSILLELVRAYQPYRGQVICQHFTWGAPHGSKALSMLAEKHAGAWCYTLSAPSWGPRPSFAGRGGRPDICRVFVSCVDAFLDMGGVASCTG